MQVVIRTNVFLLGVVVVACADDKLESLSSSTGVASSGSAGAESTEASGTPQSSGGDAVCGDGELAPFVGELCDDGNLTDDDGCNSACLPSGAEMWRVSLGEPQYAVYGPLIEASGEVLVPFDPVGWREPSGLLRVSAEGVLLGVVEPELFPDSVGRQMMRGIHFSQSGGLRYATLAADGVSYDWVESATDGSASSRTPLTWSGEHSGASAVAPTPLGLLVVSNNVDDISAVGLAAPMALDQEIIPLGMVQGLVFPTLVATDDGAFLVGGQLYGSGDIARPSVWHVTNDGVVEMTVDETLRDDRWFTSAALDNGALLLSDNDSNLWRLEEELEEQVVRGVRVFDAPGSGWWVLPDAGPAARVDTDLSTIYTVDSFAAVQSLAGVGHEGDVVVVEYRAGSADGKLSAELELARYAP